MTEYDFSPEAYERHMATQTRISNWVNAVSQSTQKPTESSPHHSSDYHQHRSRPLYSQQHTYSQTHSRSNSASRSHTREPHHYNREPARPRSHSHSSSRPQTSRAYTSQPIYSRAYSYALNQPPPVPVMAPPPLPYPHPVPRRSRTLPLPQPHNVVYHHTYDAPRGGPAYVIVPPVPGGVPPQIGMRSAVRIPHSFLFFRMVWCLQHFLLFSAFGRSRRQNGPSRSHCSSAYSRASDHGVPHLQAPRQSPSTHHQGGIGGGAATEVPLFIP